MLENEHVFVHGGRHDSVKCQDCNQPFEVHKVDVQAMPPTGKPKVEASIKVTLVTQNNFT